MLEVPIAARLPAGPGARRLPRAGAQPHAGQDRARDVTCSRRHRPGRPRRLGRRRLRCFGCAVLRRANRGDPPARARDARGVRPHLRGHLAGGAPGGPARCWPSARTPTSPGTGSCAPTAPWPRARASAGCSCARACRSAARRVDMRVAPRSREADVDPATPAAVAPAPRLSPRHARGGGGAARARASCESGMLHLLIQHTSASLALNENASPDVRRDFATWFDQAVPERRPVLVPHARGRRTTCPPTSRRRCSDRR